MCFVNWRFRSFVQFIYTFKKTPIFRTIYLILIVKPDIIVIAMNSDKKKVFLFKIYKDSKNWRILGPPFGLKSIN